MMGLSWLGNFIDKIAFEPNSGCWIWLGHTNQYGYGGATYQGKRWPAHRLIFVLAGGVIPDGFVTDHLCRNPCCVNPAHLEPVTQAVNICRGLAPVATRARHRAKTHCKFGHSLEGATARTIQRKSSKWRMRQCLVCKRATRLKNYPEEKRRRQELVLARRQERNHAG